MSERKIMEPETDGVLTMTVDGVPHKFRISAGDRVVFEWSDSDE